MKKTHLTNQTAVDGFISGGYIILGLLRQFCFEKEMFSESIDGSVVMDETFESKWVLQYENKTNKAAKEKDRLARLTNHNQKKSLPPCNYSIKCPKSKKLATTHPLPWAYDKSSPTVCALLYIQYRGLCLTCPRAYAQKLTNKVKENQY